MSPDHAAYTPVPLCALLPPLSRGGQWALKVPAWWPPEASLTSLMPCKFPPVAGRSQGWGRAVGSGDSGRQELAVGRSPGPQMALLK